MVFRRKPKSLEEQLQDEVSAKAKEEKKLLKQAGIDRYFSGLRENTSTYGEIGEEEKEILQKVYEAGLDSMRIMDSKDLRTGKRVLAAVALGAVETLLTQAGARYRVSRDSTNPFAPTAAMAVDILLAQYDEIAKKVS